VAELKLKLKIKKKRGKDKYDVQLSVLNKYIYGYNKKRGSITKLHRWETLHVKTTRRKRYSGNFKVSFKKLYLIFELKNV
jgi:hypothetical protein